jgi:hypothetical protein
MRISRWANLAHLAPDLTQRLLGLEIRDVHYPVRAMRVTFDSNIWQMAVTPSLASKTELYADFVTIHDALRRKQIQGFISETVGTLEAIRNLGRKAYFISIRPNVNVQVVNMTQGQAVLKVDIGTTHDQHPGLHRVLEARLQLAIALGIRLMRAPRMTIPVPALMLDLSVFADETDVPTAAARDNRWGDVMSTIEQRGVGSGLLRSLQEKAGGGVDDIEEKAFARAVAEWADGDSVAAHVAYGNDVFCTEDHAKNTGGKSILNTQNREWLAVTYNVKFATIRDLAAAVRAAPFTGA